MKTSVIFILSVFITGLPGTLSLAQDAQASGSVPLEQYNALLDRQRGLNQRLINAINELDLIKKSLRLKESEVNDLRKQKDVRFQKRQYEETIRELRKELRDKTNRLDQLLKSRDGEGNQLEEVQNRVEQLRNENVTLQQRITTMTDELRDSRSSADYRVDAIRIPLERELERLNQKFEKAASELAEKQDTLVWVIEQRDDFRTRLEETENQNRKLRDELNGLRTEYKEYQSASNSRIGELTDTLARQQRQAEELERKNETQREDIQMITEQLSTLQKEKAGLQNELAKSRKALEDQTKKTEDALSELETTRETLAAVTEEKDQLREDLQSQPELIQQEVEKARLPLLSQIDLLNQQLKEVNTEVVQDKVRVEALLQERDRLQNMVRELENSSLRMKNDLSTLEHQIQDQDRIVSQRVDEATSELSEELEKKEQEIARLRESVQQKDSRAETLNTQEKESEAQIEALRQDKQELQRELQVVKQNYQNLRDDFNKKVSSAHGDLTEELQALREEKQTWQDTLSEKAQEAGVPFRAEIENLKKIITQKDQNIRELSAQIQEAEETGRSVTQSRANLDLQLEQARATIEQYERDIAALREKGEENVADATASLNDQITRLRNQLNVQEEEISLRVAREKTPLIAKINVLEKDLVDKSLELKSMTKQIAQLTEEKSALREKTQDEQSGLERLSRELTDYERHIQHLEKTLAEREVRLRGQSERLRELQEEVNLLVSDKKALEEELFKMNDEIGALENYLQTKVREVQRPLEQEITEQEKSLRMADTALQQKESRIQDLRVENEQLKTELIRSEQDLFELRKELEP